MKTKIALTFVLILAIVACQKEVKTPELPDQTTVEFPDRPDFKPGESSDILK